jgi:ATP-dependent Clp protease ATP-binding subunit ClpC
MLARGELQTVGATTLDEYRKYIEKDAALERRFQPIQVNEPSIAQTIEILKGLRDRYENHHRVTITDAAIVGAATMADRYISDRFLPDKAIDLIDCACSRFNLKSADERVVDEAAIQFELSKMVNMPAEAIAEQESENLAHLEGQLNQEVYGQPEAITEIVDKILVSRAGLKPENKPVPNP